MQGMGALSVAGIGRVGVEDLSNSLLLIKGLLDG